MTIIDYNVIQVNYKLLSACRWAESRKRHLIFFMMFMNSLWMFLNNKWDNWLKNFSWTFCSWTLNVVHEHLNIICSWKFMNAMFMKTHQKFMKSSWMNVHEKFINQIVSFVVQEHSWTVHEHHEELWWPGHELMSMNNHELFMNIHEQFMIISPGRSLWQFLVVSSVFDLSFYLLCPLIMFWKSAVSIPLLLFTIIFGQTEPLSFLAWEGIFFIQ